jgi:hypothetical protein
MLVLNASNCVPLPVSPPNSHKNALSVQVNQEASTKTAYEPLVFLNFKHVIRKIITH